MRSALLIVGTVLLYSFQTLFCAIYTKRYPGRAENASPVFCVLEGVAISLFTWIWIGFKFELSPLTLLFGALNAIVLFCYNTSLIKASARGSYAFMNVAMLFGGILIPLLYTTVILGDTLQWYQYLGIALMLVSFVLMNYKEIKLRGSSWSYYVFCGIIFLTNGLYGTIIKMQAVYHVNQNNEMIIITFGLMGLIAFVQLIAKEKKETIKAFHLSKKAILPLALCLLSASLAINLVIIVISLVNTAIYYTVENGGVLICATIFSYLLFKEKPQLDKILGILVAVISITILSI